eukprot:CAMPEP_0185542294 /NCGR_PEP_ID=MMETSP1381-20130426/2545_1 /TAXON_ID=298111 /ORGANISM="Pavlova sp., Strain CCMP459" /LENGTH=32 /DNA_ID= /DNA_START= /DNA_END= /DNA_ORIENTATION=
MEDLMAFSCATHGPSSSWIWSSYQALEEGSEQ